jgi:transitional endoplasmic reticulum ATPase
VIKYLTFFNNLLKYASSSTAIISGNMVDTEPFTLIEESASSGPHHLFDNVADLSSAKTADHDLQYVAALRKANPEMIVTSIPTINVNLRAFAASGFATCELDTLTDSFASWRGYVAPAVRSGSGQLGEQIHFAKYHYSWSQEDFILYTVSNVQYILKERVGSEQALGPSHITDKLILTVGEWQSSSLNQTVLVYDGYWQRSRDMWLAAQKASWDKVILDETMKKALTNVVDTFFDSEDTYEDLGVPWKRGLIFGGEPGNGKTISIKALMHTLLFERKDPIPTLYVRNAPQTYDIGAVFTMARRLAPCMLVLEDIETIVTPRTRSYFFNEMDGLENNDGLFVVASTNFLDKLDPGLAKRPSRFDRTYIFPLPNEHERTLYCEFWRRKLEGKKTIEFPHRLCGAMAGITEGFSFAFLQECFVAALLTLAREEEGLAVDFWELARLRRKDSLEQYALWRAFKEQAEALRKQIEDGKEEGAGELDADAGALQRCECSGGARSPSQPTEQQEEALEDASGLVAGGMLPVLPFSKQRVVNSSAIALV